MSIGDTLEDARLHAGLTVTQVSQQTRIRESIIRDIEHDDFAACGGDFYARGHIRSIAGVVGTDPAPLITKYDHDHGPAGPIRAADVFQPSRPIKIRERRSPSLALIVALVLLAVIGYGAYRLVSFHDRSGHPTSAPPTVRPTVHPVSKPKPSPTLPPSHPSELVITIAAGQEPCWVLLTRASNGSQIYMNEIQPGTSVTWTEKGAVDIRLGNPPAITLTVNGHRQPITAVNPVTLSFSPQRFASSPSPARSPGSTSGEPGSGVA